MLLHHLQPPGLQGSAQTDASLQESPGVRKGRTGVAARGSENRARVRGRPWHRSSLWELKA